MPGGNVQQFEHPINEADAGLLASEMSKQRERPEMKGVHEKEILRQAIRSLGGESVSPSVVVQDDDESPLPAYVQKSSSSVKLEIENLLGVAIEKGITRANHEAKKSDPFVMDAFHDALAGRLYDHFREKGLL